MGLLNLLDIDANIVSTAKEIMELYLDSLKAYIKDNKPFSEEELLLACTVEMRDNFKCVGYRSKLTELLKQLFCFMVLGSSTCSKNYESGDFKSGIDRFLYYFKLNCESLENILESIDRLDVTIIVDLMLSRFYENLVNNRE